MGTRGLPSGWGERPNTWSENELVGRGAAARWATNEGDRSAYAAAGAAGGARPTDEQVAEFYLQGPGARNARDEKEDANEDAAKGLPAGWAARSRERATVPETPQTLGKEREAKKPYAGSTEALARVATFALEQLAEALEAEAKGGAHKPLPHDDKQKLTAAVKSVLAAAARHG